MLGPGSFAAGGLLAAGVAGRAASTGSPGVLQMCAQVGTGCRAELAEPRASRSDAGTELKSVSEVQSLLTAEQVQMPRDAPTPDWEAAGSLPGAGDRRTLPPRLLSQPPGSNCLRMQSGWDIFHSERHLHTALSHTGMCLRVHKHRHFHEQKRFPELRAECVSLGARVAICTRAGTAARDTSPALPCPACPGVALRWAPQHPWPQLGQCVKPSRSLPVCSSLWSEGCERGP